jgi:threonylcarbamoyladenosine tRNA methylthiotransferase MtaB
VIADVRRALAVGHREIVLTGINIGTYDGGWSERGARGAHRRSTLTLAGLVRRLLDETGVERIRLSSIEPQHVDDELLRVWTDGAPRTMPHLHLPLQSGDDGVLRRMGRRYTTGDYEGVLRRAREAIPGVAVHGDVIVGFPTEDGAAWQRSVDFIRSVGYAGIHVFRYSARPGTAATRMTGQVDEPTKRRRSAELLEHAARAREAWAAARIGGRADVLFETWLDDGRWAGHAADHTLVAVQPERPADELENVIGVVAIDAVDPSRHDRVMGRILSQSPPPISSAPRNQPRPTANSGAPVHVR